MYLVWFRGFGLSFLSKVKKTILENPLLHSFVIFSIFRAFYGTGILFVTWLLFTNENMPKLYSVIFLLFSMVFSRFIFKKFIRQKSSS